MLKNIWGHFKVITRHKFYVMRNCFRAGIPWQGITHDLSKYSPTEFIPGAKYYQGFRSPNEKEREEIGYSTAWMHHKGRNKHHYEYWTDFSVKEHGYRPVPMPWKYVVEMFCDRVAASKIYYGKDYTDSAALDYFNMRSDKYKMNLQTAQKLEFLLMMLAERGEDETFRFIRSLDKVRGIEPDMV